MTDAVTGIPIPLREILPLRRSFRLYSLLSAPYDCMCGAAAFSLAVCLVLGVGISPLEAGFLATAAAFPKILPSGRRTVSGFGSIPAALGVLPGYIEIIAAGVLFFTVFAMSDSPYRIIFFCASVLFLSTFSVFRSETAAVRLHGLFPGQRGESFRGALRFRAAGASVASLIIAGMIFDLAGAERLLSCALVFTAAFSLELFSRIPLKGISFAQPARTAVEALVSGDSSPFNPDTPVRFRVLDVLVSFSAGMLPPFFIMFIFSPECLEMSPAGAAMHVSLFAVFALPGGWFWKRTVDRFGARAVLQCAIPLLAGTLLLVSRIASGEGLLLAPLAAVAGFLFPGISAGTDRLFGNNPGKRKILPSFYTPHCGAGNCALVFSPIVAGCAVYGIGSYYGVSAIPVIFPAAAALLACALPLLLIRGSQGGESLACAVRTVARGNLLLFAWNALLLLRARTEESRAHALLGLGRSRSPLAEPSLLELLDDPGPEVRKQTIRALGKIRSSRAVPVLVREMEDQESDLRCEAAEALGKIGGHGAILPLMKALHDRNTRLRNSAITALGEIGGEEVMELLTELFVLSYDSDAFPTIAESLSRLGAREIVEPVMMRLGEYESLVIRLQLLNSVCRVLGAENMFYRILSMHEYARVDEVNRIIRQARRHAGRSKLFQKETIAGMDRILRNIAESYRSEDHRAFLRFVWEFMAYIQLVIPEAALTRTGERINDGEHPLLPYIEAVNRFLILKKTEDIRDEGMVFLVICINCLLATM